MPANELPAVIDIVERIRKKLSDPACVAVGLERDEAQSIVDYFDDIGGFAAIVLDDKT